MFSAPFLYCFGFKCTAHIFNTGAKVHLQFRWDKFRLTPLLAGRFLPFQYQVFKANLYGEKYVWILLGWYPDGWWSDASDVPCTNEEFLSTLDLHISFDGDQAIDDVALIDFNGVVSFVL